MSHLDKPVHRNRFRHQILLALKQPSIKTPVDGAIPPHLNETSHFIGNRPVNQRTHPWDWAGVTATGAHTVDSVQKTEQGQHLSLTSNVSHLKPRRQAAEPQSLMDIETPALVVRSMKSRCQ